MTIRHFQPHLSRSDALPSTTSDVLTPASRTQQAIRIITHNIRYAANEPERTRHEKAWSERLTPFTQQLHFLTRLPASPARSILCVQECLTNQFNDIASALGSEWIAFGVGRDDGKEQGERCAVFFRSRFWNLLHSETVWLNENRKVGRKGWDAGCVRLVSCLVLQSKNEVQAQWSDLGSNGQHGKTLLLMNTHLDNSGKISRRESAKILLEVKDKLREEWNVDAVAMAGDLNSETDGEAYLTLTHESSGLVDAKYCVKDHSRYGDQNTFSGFGPHGDGEKAKRIDFVFLGEGDLGQDLAQGYSVLPNVFDAGVWISDHRAVVVDFRL